ncbi:Transcription factor, fungi [Penicillium expansum]|nr:Transcription factor, fungi [Penicillium expansum]
MGDNYTIHKVSLKRTRQACGPCRLGQHCSYGPQPSRVKPHSVSARAQSQETQHSSINEIQGDISSSGRLQRIEERLDMMALLLQEGLPRSNSLREVSSDTQLNDDRELQEASYDDLEIMDCPKSHSLASPDSLPPEVAFALVALTSRLPRRSRGPLHENRPDGKTFAERAWDLLSSQYKDGKMGLSFLQGTFLMAQVDFADGKAHRAYASVALGLRVIQSVGLNKEEDSYRTNEPEIETRKRITWAFFMLDRTYSASRNYSLSLSDKQFTLPFPALETEALFSENGPLTHGSLHDGPGKQGQKVDHGILVCLLRLFSLWGKSTEYVFEPFAESSLPPWQTGSALAVLESEWLQFETHFADAHRYINVDFKSCAREDPRPRTYLSTWVCVQFLFHSIQGLLHHPFVIMTKLRNFNGNLSATFLQKSFETSLLHSRWIVRFIREMSDVNFETCDPFLGYLAAIAATIQLEHTGNKNPQIALLLNKEFQILVDFMTELSVYWENMSVLVNKVNELAARHQNYGSLYYNQEGFSGALSKMPTPSNMPRMSAEDEGLMWEILDFGCSSGGDKAMNFGNLAIPQDIQANEGHPAQRRPSSRIQRAGQQNKNDQRGRMTPSVPNLDEISESINEGPLPEWPFQARDGGDMIGAAMPDIPDWMILGDYMAEHLEHEGYQLLKVPEVESPYPQLRSVAIYGGAKSSFGLVYFFATLNRNDSKLHLKSTEKDLVQVHWIIRDRGSTLPNCDTVASDNLSEPPGVCTKGLEDTAQYGSNRRIEKLRPENSVLVAHGAGLFGNQLYNTAMLVLLNNRPRTARIADFHSVAMSPLWHAQRICSIALHNDSREFWDPYILASFLLAARWMTHESQQHEVVHAFDRIRTVSGWNAHNSLQSL